MSKKYDVPWHIDVFDWIFMSKGFTWREWRDLSRTHTTAGTKVRE